MGRKLTPVHVRVWKYVTIPEDRTQCWLWTGTVRGKNYPNIMGNYIKGQKLDVREASHVVYELTRKEPVPKGKCLASKCGNHLCVNPDHKIVCDFSEVAKIASSYGRMLKACTPSDVLRVKELILTGRSNREIAVLTGIDRSVVMRIRHNDTGKNIGPLIQQQPKHTVTLERVGNVLGVTRQAIHQLTKRGLLSWKLEDGKLIVTRRAEVYVEGVGRVDPEQQDRTDRSPTDAPQATQPS